MKVSLDVLQRAKVARLKMQVDSATVSFRLPGRFFNPGEGGVSAILGSRDHDDTSSGESKGLGNLEADASSSTGDDKDLLSQLESA